MSFLKRLFNQVADRSTTIESSTESKFATRIKRGGAYILIESPGDLDVFFKQPFTALPMEIRILDAIRTQSTVLQLETIGDFFRDVVFAHRPLPELSADDRDFLLFVVAQIHQKLNEWFGTEYVLYIEQIESINKAAFWMPKSNPYWININYQER